MASSLASLSLSLSRWRGTNSSRHSSRNDTLAVPKRRIGGLKNGIRCDFYCGCSV
nr:MAG TPA: hypothetical protein [Bacteriophage sp.]